MGKKIILFILIMVLIFLYTYFVLTLHFDEIWNYGFSYNIANGLVPYLDFNFVVTPLYPMLGAVFIKIFGHHLYGVHILNALVITIMIFLMKKEIGKKVFIVLPILLLVAYFSYNLFCLFLMVILLYFVYHENKIKYSDEVIALIVSFLFLTKQNIGILCFIPMIYYSKNRIKSFISFCIPVFIFLIYLLWNNALYQFIDYCFLGLFDFGKGNSIYDFFIFWLFIVIFLLSDLFHSKFKNKLSFYVLMFQTIALPIIDSYHFLVGFVLFLYYILMVKKTKNYKYKYYFIISLATFFLIQGDFCNHYYLYNDKKSFMYLRPFDSIIQKGVDGVGNYILEQSKVYGDNIYLFSSNAYLIKMNIGYNLNKFDLINNGNMGYHGDFQYIQEIDKTCKGEKCLFVMGMSEITFDNNSQLNRDILNYVSKNYNKVEELYGFSIYKS